MALLVVLATLVLVTTAATLLAGAASSIQSKANIDRFTLIADEMLNAAEDPIQHWLSLSSAKVVLPPDATSPRVSVLHDRLRIGDVEVELRITAWDQFGMVPMQLVKAASPLRLVVPAELLTTIDSTQNANDTTPGIDLYIGTKVDGGQVWSVSPFPEPANGLVTAFDAKHESSDVQGDASAVALGEWIATDNASHSINVNTAPIALVDAALRASQRGGLDQIIAARTAGKPAIVPSGRTVNSSTEQITPQLVGSSNAWSFRIDSRVGPVRKSWWAIYSPAPRGSNWPKSRSGMECVQRLVISH